jgi:hypothetical protein
MQNGPAPLSGAGSGRSCPGGAGPGEAEEALGVTHAGR